MAPLSSNNGNIQSQTIVTPGSNSWTQTYQYDSLNRLTNAVEAGGGSEWQQGYVYDQWGNRALYGAAGYYAPVGVPQVADRDPGEVTALYPNNRWNAVSYDGGGNQETNLGQQYSFDAENRVLTATVPGMGAIAYGYDGDGRRVTKTVGGVSATFVYDATGALAAEYGPTGTETGTSYLVADQLGSTRLVLESTGDVKRYDYFPFGEEIPQGYGGRGTEYSTAVYPSSPDAVSQKFTGKERDAETGLDYFGARYLSAALGRFTSADPVMSAPERLRDPQQFNRYAYARNSPLRYLDPTGEKLELSGDVNEAQKQLCEILGTSDCASRISHDQKTNIITVNMSGINLAENEGASLLNQLVGSSKLYDLTLGSEFMTAAGKTALDDAVRNLNNEFDLQYALHGGRTASERPAPGVDDVIAINPAIASHFSDSQWRHVPLSAIIFHELAEACGKVDLGKQYSDHPLMRVDNGGTVVLFPFDYVQGAHNYAVDREIKLRNQRPSLQLTGRAGDQLIRDPK